MSDDERQEQLKAAEEAYGAFEKRLAEQRSKSDGGNNGDQQELDGRDRKANDAT